MQRETLEFDVLIVGAGPAGLSAACRLRQLAVSRGEELSVCVLEKGSEVGAHILSGALFETSALDELFPDWQTKDAPVNIAVTEELLCYFTNSSALIAVPHFLIPGVLRNRNNYIISLANLCRWLGRQAEALDANIFPGFAASNILYDEDGSVAGVICGDMGVGKNGQPKPSFEPGMAIRAKYTLFAEGCHGHLGKELMQRFDLRRDADPQHYGLGIKEIWKISPDKHKQGQILHSFGWPLGGRGDGGGFLYHIENNQVTLGFISGLNYANPYFNPYEEMQRWKLHPKIRAVLEGGSRVAYGARAINKGGLQSLPRLYFPGGLLLGCEAGFLNPAKLKGVHNAMKSGMLAADTVVSALRQEQKGGAALEGYEQRLRAASIYDELYRTRNVAPLLRKFGIFVGGILVWWDQTVFRGRLPFTLRNQVADHAALKPTAKMPTIDYPRHDGKVSFDILSSVALSNTNHEENQPCHLQLLDKDIPVTVNLPLYDEPAQRYCPAKVYEILQLVDGPVLQINAQNCLHCKTCDIKDPSRNINWTVPEGGGGPNYSNM